MKPARALLLLATLAHAQQAPMPMQLPAGTVGGTLGGVIGGAFGQPSAGRPVSSDCSHHGVVLSAATGEPIARARVVLSGPLGQTSTLTDATGRFAFTNASCGQVSLIASRVGFLQSITAPRTGARPSPLAPGAASHDSRILLTPQSVVVGTVSDDQGDPVQNAQVTLLTSRIVQGRRGFQQSASAQSNDLGEFRIPGLSAGRTIVCAQINAAPGDAVAEQKCFPGPPEAGAASAFELGAGQTARVSITLAAVPAVSVRGTVSNLPKNRGVSLTLVRRSGGGAAGRSANVMPDGRFELRGIAPGSYMLNADYWDSNKRYTTRQPIEVGGSDVDGVAVTLTEGFSVNGIVRIESTRGGDLPKPANLGISLRSAEPMVGGGRLQWSPDGATFSLVDLTPGTYRLESFIAQGGLYIKRALYNGRDISREDVPITQGGGSIEMVLADDGGKVEGYTENRDGKPLSTWVMIMEDGRTPRNARSDDAGHFMFQNIAPGNYTLYAWDDISQVEYADPDWMRRHALGQKVKVEVNQTSLVRLTESSATSQR